jgi:hypothetical protein
MKVFWAVTLLAEKFLVSVRNYSPNDTASHPRKLESSAPVL